MPANKYEELCNRITEMKIVKNWISMNSIGKSIARTPARYSLSIGNYLI